MKHQLILGLGTLALGLTVAVAMTPVASSATPAVNSTHLAHSVLLQDGHASPTLGKACARRSFKTKMVEAACKKGGQKQAKKAMRKFLKMAKKATKTKMTCKTCHSKSSGKYPLKKDGLKNFRAAKKAM